MQPNILILCKLAFLLLVINQFYFYLEDPFLPFLNILDAFNEIPDVIKIIQRVLFVLAGILLWLNYRVRLMALILGLVVLFALLASKPLFRNHIFILACIFILAALSAKNNKPWLLFWQFSLVYFGAFLNKILQIDWWNGQFMHNWLLNARENIVYISLLPWFPEMLLAKIISWMSMAIELVIALLLLNRRKHFMAFWLILLFHGILYTMVLFRFGHFMEDILLLLLIFINWPKGSIKVKHKTNKSLGIIGLLKSLNLNKQVVYKSLEMKDDIWLEATIKNRTVTNWTAFRYLLLYSPGFYFMLFGLDIVVRLLTNNTIMHITTVVIMWIFLLLFSPFLIKKRWHLNEKTL